MAIAQFVVALCFLTVFVACFQESGTDLCNHHEIIFEGFIA